VSKEESEKLLEGYLYPTLEEQSGEDYFGGDGLATDLASTAEFLEAQGEIDALAEDEVYSRMPYADAIEEVAQ
jgi:taurine transport system substrate-binding protein